MSLGTPNAHTRDLSDGSAIQPESVFNNPSYSKSSSSSSPALNNSEDSGPQRFLPPPDRNISLFGGPEMGNPQQSPAQAGGQSRYLQILEKLPSMAEFYGVAHRASIDVMGQTLRKVRKTGIICTIGPKTNSPEGLAGLRKSGMNIMRMNFSHGTHEYHATVIGNLYKSFHIYREGPPVAIALDTKGPVRQHTLTLTSHMHTCTINQHRNRNTLLTFDFFLFFCLCFLIARKFVLESWRREVKKLN